MDLVEFRLQVEELGVGRLITVTPFVNGVSLIELARRAEVLPASKAGEEHLAGSYAGLVVGPSLGDRTDWHRWFLDGGQENTFVDGTLALLGCTCGDIGCGPLLAQIDITEERIRWAGFRNGHHDWDLSGFGPFEFGRSQYFAALDRPNVSF